MAGDQRNIVNYFSCTVNKYKNKQIWVICILDVEKTKFYMQIW